jgi:hypothetical protein
MFWHALLGEEDLGTLTGQGFNAYLFCLIVVFWGFVLGMVSFVVFVMKNFYWV